MAASDVEAPHGEMHRRGSLAWIAGQIAWLTAIALGGLLFCCMAAVVTILVVVASQGREGAADLLQRLQFDVPLKTRIGACVVGALYLGLAASAVLAAVATRRGAWRSRLALPSRHRAGRAAIVAILATLSYGAAATYTLVLTQDHHLIVSGPTDVLLIALVIVNLGILAPVAEELVFRGWLYTGLRERLAFVPSFIVVASLFAAIHWSGRHILLVVPLAVALGLLRELTGSVRATILLHALYNLLSVAITLWTS